MLIASMTALMATVFIFVVKPLGANVSQNDTSLSQVVNGVCSVPGSLVDIQAALFELVTGKPTAPVRVGPVAFFRTVTEFDSNHRSTPTEGFHLIHSRPHSRRSVDKVTLR